jgi:aryl-alcohol dehydrogenase-like predicted oxidoreductase
MFGTAIDEKTSFAVLDRFVEGGGEWIDTADCYSFWASETGFGGDSERLIGRWLAARPGMRDRVKIATKFGAEPTVRGGYPEQVEGLTPDAIATAFAGSLERLGTDHVELAFAHVEDRSVPIDETWDAMSRLTGSPALGFSNHALWRIAHLPMAALQHSYSYLHPRAAEIPPGQDHEFGMMNDEVLDFGAARGVDLWAYTPLLSGAYDNPAKAIPEVFEHAGSTRRLAALTSVASELGVPRGQVVLAWLVAHGIHPILGGSKVEQLDAALAGASLELTPEFLARLDAA